MGKTKEFKTVEEALAHIAKQDEALAALGTAKATAVAEATAAKAEVIKITKERDEAVKDAAEAQEIAKSAVEMANASAASNKSTDITVKVGGVKYIVAFGVDGLSKEDLAKDTEKCAKLVKRGTAALVKAEG